jgi:hypothetical protein
MDPFSPSAWNGSWNDAPNSPSVAGAVSAMTRAIRAASALNARGRTTCKRMANATPDLMLALLRLVRQCSLTRSNGSGGQLCEVSGSSPVDFRHRVGVVPQCGRSAAAVTKTRCCLTQVKPRREQLTCRVVPQPFDIELDAGRRRQVAGLMRGPVRIPWPGAHRIIREHVGIIGQLKADGGQLARIVPRRSLIIDMFTLVGRQGVEP